MNQQPDPETPVGATPPPHGAPATLDAEHAGGDGPLPAPPLGGELQATRAELRRTIEALRRSNEALQAANEEAQTSREELQALNEELETVNAELRGKVDELGSANSDLRNLFSATEIATIFLDLEMRVTRYTPAATALFHLIEADLGRPLADLAPRFAGQDLVADAREVVRHQEPVERHVRLVEGAWCILRVTLYRTVAGVVAGVVVTGVDVSGLKRAEEEVRRSEHRFQVLIENLNAAVALIDDAGRFCLYNPQFLKLFGLEPGSDIKNVNDQDWSAWQVYDENGRLLDVDEHPVRKAALRRQAVSNQLIRVRLPQGGDPRWLLVSAEPVFDAGGRIENIICTYHDVTQRKGIETSLEEANQRLREDDRQKNEFLALLSHELRNPLAPIRNSLQVLIRAVPGSEPALRALEIIDRQSGQLSRLVDDLLDVTRISRNKIQLQRAPLDLDDLVRRTVEDYRSLFEGRGITLGMELVAGPLPMVGDRERLAQAIGNLLQNAAKFTPAGGRVRVVTGSVAAEGRATIRVLDTGAGIEPAMVERLFVPFVQAVQPLDRSQGGLGLGLALVKGIVELHGGEVGARSEGPGRGAEFVVSLPFDPQTPASPDTVRRAEAGHPGRRVLIIEDNVDAAESLRMALELSGHQVAIAHGGLAGTALAGEFLPEVVLCDIGLPGMNGYEVARALRADARLAGTTLVALSGYAMPEDLEQARNAGFQAHLAKPPSLEQLEELVRRAP